MSWYYAENGKQIGPVTDEEWQTLTSTGKILPTSLVWKEGMPSWQAWSSLGGSAVPPAADGTVVCSFCQKSFPADEVIQLDGRNVCGSCKPMAVQVVKEGLNLPTTLQYAGFWIRFGAKLIDSIILWVVGLVFGGIIGVIAVMTGGNAEEPNALQIILMVVMYLLLFAIQIGYNIYFVGKKGATPGKMACGLKVIRPDGSPMTYGRATGRFFAEWVTGMTLGIGYIMAGFDEEKRSLHDRIADTRVVTK